jgi:hypothetical protein
MNIAPVRKSLLVLVCVAQAACEGLIVSPAESNQNVDDFEATWAWVDSVYPAFDIKQIDWPGVYADYRPRAEQAQGDDFFQVLNDMLVELEDPHLYYATKGGARFYPYMSPRLLSGRKTFSAHLLRTYFDGELSVAGKDGVEYGILDGTVGYIRITHFNTDGMMDDFPSVLASVEGTEGLIIDVRNNTGGDHDKREHVHRVGDGVALGRQRRRSPGRALASHATRRAQPPICRSCGGPDQRCFAQLGRAVPRGYEAAAQRDGRR